MKILLILLFVLFISHGRLLKHTFRSQPQGPISSWDASAVMEAGERVLNSCSNTPANCETSWIFGDLDDSDIKLYIFRNSEVNQYLKVPEVSDLIVFESSKEHSDLPRWWGMFQQRKYLDLPDPSNPNHAKMRDLSIRLCNAFSSSNSFSDPAGVNQKYMHPLTVMGGGVSIVRAYETGLDQSNNRVEQSYFKAMNTFPFSVGIEAQVKGFGSNNNNHPIYLDRLPANMISFENIGLGVKDARVTGDMFPSSGRYTTPMLFPEMGSHNNSYFYSFPFTCPTGTDVYLSQKEDGSLCNEDGSCRPRSPTDSSHSDDDIIDRGGYSIDWACKNSNQDVIAARDGWVLNILQSESRNGGGINCGFMGNYVEILHNDGSIAMYLHFKRNSVPSSLKIGDYVTVGTKLGVCGNTGCSTGRHLHYTVHTYKYVSLPENRARNDYIELEPLHPPVYKCGDPPRTETSNKPPANLGANPWGIADWNTDVGVSPAPTIPGI